MGDSQTPERGDGPLKVGNHWFRILQRETTTLLDQPFRILQKIGISFKNNEKLFKDKLVLS